MLFMSCRVGWHGHEMLRENLSEFEVIRVFKGGYFNLGKHFVIQASDGDLVSFTRFKISILS